MVEARLLHRGGIICKAEAWSAKWRLGLPSKSGRLVSALRKLIASGGSLPRRTAQKLVLYLINIILSLIVDNSCSDLSILPC